MHRAAHVVKGSPDTLRFELFPNDWTLLKGHRLGLRLTMDDPDWYLPTHSAQPVEVAGGTLEVPFLTYVRDGFLEQNETPSMGARNELTLDEETIAGAVTAAELPGALTPRRSGTPQGAAPAPPGAAAPANRLRIRSARARQAARPPDDRRRRHLPRPDHRPPREEARPRADRHRAQRARARRPAHQARRAATA